MKTPLHPSLLGFFEVDAGNNQLVLCSTSHRHTEATHYKHHETFPSMLPGQVHAGPASYAERERSHRRTTFIQKDLEVIIKICLVNNNKKLKLILKL